MLLHTHTHSAVVVAASRTINQALPVGRATQFPVSLSRSLLLLRSTFGHSKYIFNCSNFFLLFLVVVVCNFRRSKGAAGVRGRRGVVQEVCSTKHAAFKFTQSAAAATYIVHRHFIIK